MLQVPPIPPLPPIVYLEQIVLPVLGIALAAFLGWGLLRIVNTWLTRRSGGGGDLEALRGEVQQLREGVQGTTDLRDRVAELEERLDFAERILAQQRERTRLGPANPER